MEAATARSCAGDRNFLAVMMARDCFLAMGRGCSVPAPPAASWPDPVRGSCAVGSLRLTEPRPRKEPRPAEPRASPEKKSSVEPMKEARGPARPGASASPAASTRVRPLMLAFCAVACVQPKPSQ